LREAGTAIPAVKITTFDQNGWTVQVGRRSYSVGNRAPRVPYDPDELDFFFILDGDLTMYLIPSRVIAGRVGILLHNYSEFIVAPRGILHAERKPGRVSAAASGPIRRGLRCRGLRCRGLR